jgi:hypothetical protein
MHLLCYLICMALSFTEYSLLLARAANARSFRLFEKLLAKLSFVNRSTSKPGLHLNDFFIW